MKTIMTGLRYTSGIASDSIGNIVFNDLATLPNSLVPYNYIIKATKDGRVLDSYLIGQQWDQASLSQVRISSIPNSDQLVGVREQDGSLMLITTDPFEVMFLGSISELPIVSSSYYNLTAAQHLPATPVSLANSNYGDIAVYDEGGNYTLFVAGQSKSSSVQFVLRLRVSKDFSKLIDSDIIIGGYRGLAREASVYPRFEPQPLQSLLPGIAVNSQGIVLVSLPSWEGGEIYASNDLVTFQADFEPNAGASPTVLDGYTFVESFGMTTDDHDFYYVIEHESANVRPSKVLVIPPSLGPPIQVEYLPSFLPDEYAKGDIAVVRGESDVYLTHPSSSSYPDSLTESFILGFASLAGFDPANYLASYGDLIEAFGYNLPAATKHYIEYGYPEGRAADLFDEANYLASYGDLITAFGYDLPAATKHYIEYGYPEGRAADLFDEANYLASYGDLITAFGYDLPAATKHYIEYGYPEGRAADLFDEANYLASYGDLITAFGYDLPAATIHYIEYGFSEGRETDLFDPAFYISQYSDLQLAFGGDLVAATKHYIEFGFYEGRVGIPVASE